MISLKTSQRLCWSISQKIVRHQYKTWLIIMRYRLWIESVNYVKVTNLLIILCTVCFRLRISVRSGQKLWTTNVVKLRKQWRSLVMCSAPFMNQKAPRRLLRNQFQVLLCLSFKSSLNKTMCIILFCFTLFLLGQRSSAFLGEFQKKSNDDDGMNLEGADRDKAIKFEKVCLLTTSKCIYIHSIASNVIMCSKF